MIYSLNDISLRASVMVQGEEAASNNISCLLNPYEDEKLREWWDTGHKNAVSLEKEANAE